MPRLNDIFGGNYLKAEDLGGRAVTVTIEDVEVKEFDDGKKLVIGFAGKEKKLVCNRTNASIIEEVTGESDTDNWIGKKVVLVVKKVEFQGKLVPAIRVDLNAVQQRPAPVAQDEGDGSQMPF